MSDDNCVEHLATCPVCGQGDLSGITVPCVKIGENFFGDKLRLFGLVSCRECGLEFVNPRPTEGFLSAFYDTIGYPAHDAIERSVTARSTNAFRLRLLQDLGPPGRKLLDYGCGSGCFAQMAKEAGWNTVAVEPSTIGRKSAGDLGVEVYGGTEDLPGNSKYDVITLFHVLEHVSNPGEVLRATRSILDEKGLLVVEVPNIHSLRAVIVGFLKLGCSGDERYRSFPIHLYGFGRKTLCRLLFENGYFVVKASSFYVGKTFVTVNKSDFAKDGQRVISPDVARTFPMTGWLKDLVKKFLFDLYLGENLVVVARRSSTVNL